MISVFRRPTAQRTQGPRLGPGVELHGPKNLVFVLSAGLREAPLVSCKSNLKVVVGQTAPEDVLANGHGANQNLQSTARGAIPSNCCRFLPEMQTPRARL